LVSQTFWEWLCRIRKGFNTVDVSETTFTEYYIPFKAAVDAGELYEFLQ
jgi:hypothetical protein